MRAKTSLLSAPILGLACCLITLLPVKRSLAAQRRVVDRLEASVNAAPILRSDITKARKLLPLRSQLDPLFAGSALAEKGTSGSDAEWVESLIQDRLILSAFPVSDAEVEQEIQAIQASNRIDRNKLKAALHQQGFAFEDYFELIRSSTAKRNLIDRDIRTKVSISDSEVKALFESKFGAKSGGAFSHQVRLLALARSSFKSEAALRETAERARAALLSGDSFQEVVARYGDESARESGGDLGTLTEDQMSPPIRSAIKGLKPGSYSAIFGDPKSRLMILQLVSSTQGEDPRFQKAKDELRNQLAASEYQHQIQLWLARQRQVAFIHLAPSSTQ